MVKRNDKAGMRDKPWTRLALTALAAVMAATSLAQSPSPSTDRWLLVKIGVIGPASEDILETALEDALSTGHGGIIIALDTPGGAVDSARNMVKSIMAAPVPVVVWVGPSGSRAGSAGAFLTVAAHVAAMAPGTNIGAAHPVEGSGTDIAQTEMDRKITNDTVAFIESIAKARGRNVEVARSFVSTSESITDEQALKSNIIDLIAKDLPQLLAAVDGRNVELSAGRKVQLATAHASLDDFQPSFRQRLLEILSNPNLFYLLFMAGIIGLGYELTHPGILFPGVVGAICLVLALIASSVLPVSYGAAALILLGVAMLVGEAFAPSFGVLGIGGLVAFTLGSVFLVDPHNQMGLRVSWYAIAPATVTVGGAFLALGYLVLKQTRAPVRSGKEGLLGAVGTVIADFVAAKGQIRVAGGIWNAQTNSSASAPKKGSQVRVIALNGLTVDVEELPRPEQSTISTP